MRQGISAWVVPKWAIPMKSVRLITLGCAKNEVDSEEIAGVLRQAGYRLDPASSVVDAVVINTCGFLAAAREEGIEQIANAIREKRAGGVRKVIVAGCLSQRMGLRLLSEAPGADAYIGVGQMARFGQILDKVFDSSEPLVEIAPPSHLWADVLTRARSGAPWSAYLKVSEGCDHKCTFCTIPSFRGKHLSKPIERVMAEARHLSRTGARELNLIAQDVTQYGFDLYGKFTLPALLRSLNEVEGIDWIRILYFYPNRLTDEVIEAMVTLPKVLPYIDIPLQHAHPDVLRAMKRPWSGDRYLELFKKLRKSLPDCAIRSTMIVGFPGETEQQFEYLLDFVAEAKFDRLGAFPYSREKGTPSFDYPNQIPDEIKQERFYRIMRMQQDISLEINESYVGKRVAVLVEHGARGGEGAVGRSVRDAPEIDGLVFVNGDPTPGDLLECTITDADVYDLYGNAGRTISRSESGVTPLRLVN